MNSLRTGKQSSIARVSSPSRIIRDYIKKKELVPGNRLPTHDELCKQLGIGLRRLREGLSVLRQQGLIETKRRGGTIIKSVSARAFEAPISWRLEELGCGLEDLIRARAVVESAAAGEAARSRKARDLLVMLDAVEQIEASEPASDEDEKADEAFHMALLKATNNPALLMFGELIAGQFNLKVAEQKSIKAAEKSHVQHREIFEAIENRDVESARKAMYEHVIGQLDEIKSGRKIKK